MNKIDGGYYLKAKKVQQSDISKSPPHVREIWDWFLMKANFADNDKTGINRGQWFGTYNHIIKGLEWKIGYRTEKYTRWQIETAMKILTKAHMITTTKTTRGMVVNICNYCFYQDIKNYENQTRTTREPQENHTIQKEYIKKDKEIKYKAEHFASQNPLSVEVVKSFLKTLEENSTYRPRTNKQKLDWMKCAQWAINKMGDYGNEKVIDIIEHFRNPDETQSNYGDFNWADNFNTIMKLQTKNREGVFYLFYFWEKIKDEVSYG